MSFYLRLGGLLVSKVRLESEFVLIFRRRATILLSRASNFLFAVTFFHFHRDFSDPRKNFWESSHSFVVEAELPRYRQLFFLSRHLDYRLTII